MKKLSVLFICAAFLGFFSCASKPEPQLESDISSTENKEAVIEEASEPITEPEVLEDQADSLEEIKEPDVTELPPEDDEVEDLTDAENESQNADASLNQEDEEAEDSEGQTQDTKEAAEESSDTAGDSQNDTENPEADENLSSDQNAEAESTNEAEDGENSEEGTEENTEDNLEIDENEGNAEITESFPVSRSVSLKVSEYLDISYPGNGWIYMGATDNSKNITYFGRKLGTQNTNFSLQARLPGTKILHFYKNDNLTNQIIDDYIEVRVLEERGNSQTHIEAPEYKMPVKAKRPAVRTAPEEESPDFPESDNQGDEVISLVGEEAKKNAQKSKTTAQKKAAAPLAPAASGTSKPAVNENINENPQTGISSQSESQVQTEVQKSSESDLKNLLADAENKFSQQDYKSALKAVNEYLSNSKDKRDEALFLQGQILEAKSDIQDIAKAIDSYTTLTKNYPASKYWDKANKRIIYLKRFYLQGR